MSKSVPITVSQLRESLVIPFDYGHDQLKKLFSYFLHVAPSIDSASSRKLTSDEADIMWERFIEDWDARGLPYKIYKENSSYPSATALKKYYLGDDCHLSRKRSSFICFKKTNEGNLECLLRHLRNSIAHGHVYILKQSNRYFLLFEDYNGSGNKRGTMLFSQTVLENLKKLLS